MNRRRFLRTTVLSSAAGVAIAEAPERYETVLAEWRTFEIRTQIEIQKPAGLTRVWAPVPLQRNTPFQSTLTNTIKCDGGTASVVKSEQGLEMIAAEFPPGTNPALIVTSRIKTRNWQVDLSKPGKPPHPNRSELNAYLQPTKMLPTDGIVRQQAAEITASADTDVDKARAIYEWIVVNTYRNPKTRGCGTGNIRFMLESRDLGGKCADLNSLFVGLARAAGIPSRDVYGLRIAPAQIGGKTLGVSSPDVTKAQHCRAEVYLTQYGWVPVDPADVRKVILEEPPGNRLLQDELVKQTEARLFGSWEMNWIAYNYAQDVALPEASGPPLHFLMYPQAETAGGRLDCLDPDHFRYRITSHETTPVWIY